MKYLKIERYKIFIKNMKNKIFIKNKNDYIISKSIRHNGLAKCLLAITGVS